MHLDFHQPKSNSDPSYRTDIEALLGNNHYLLDVSIANPINASAIMQSFGGRQRTNYLQRT